MSVLSQGGRGEGMDWEFGVKVDKQQGPTEQHRELYSISYDKQGMEKNIKMEIYIYIYIYIYKTESLCCTAEVNTTL